MGRNLAGGCPELPPASPSHYPQKPLKINVIYIYYVTLGCPYCWCSLLYKSKGFYFLDETMSLAVQQNDFRLADDAMPDLIDIDTVFTVLLMTYLDFEPSSSVEDLTQQQGFRVFPNPAADVLNLKYWNN